MKFLTRLAECEAGVRLALRKHLAAFLPRHVPQQTAQPRSIRPCCETPNSSKTAEKKRQAEAARKKHIAEMRALATR